MKPTTPHSEPGWRIEPPVSEPSETGARPAATATAEPPLDPPGMRSSAHGLRVTPSAEFSVDEPIANSSQLVLPRTIAPAASRRSTAVAVKGGTKRSRIREAAVVGTSRVQMLSFTATGTPNSGRSAAVACSASSAAARASTRAGSTCRKAPRPPPGASRPSSRAMRASSAWATSVADVSLPRIAWRVWRAVHW